MEKRNAERKKKNILFPAAVILLLLLIVFCLYNIIPYFLNLSVNIKINEKTAETAVTDDEDWKNVVIDFDYLQSINEDIIAWIRFDNTDVVAVDYPVLWDSEDTLTYLHKNMYGKYSYAGSIFMESTNSPDFSDPQTIIYGHNMRNGTMFGTLKKYYRDNDVYADNRFFTVYTPDAAYRYQIFTYFVTMDGSFVYRTGFVLGEDQYEEHVENLCSSKIYETGVSADEWDNIVVLSTCTSRTEDERFVVIGKVIDMVSYNGGLNDK